MRPSDNSSSPEEGLGEHCGAGRQGRDRFSQSLGWHLRKRPSSGAGSLCQGGGSLRETPSHCEAAGQSRQQRGLWGQADLTLTYSPPLTPVSPGEAASLVSVVIGRMVLLGCSETG